MGCVCLPLVVDPELLLAHHVVGFTLRLGVKDECDYIEQTVTWGVSDSKEWEFL